MYRLKPCSSRNNLAAMTEPKKRGPDFVRMACTSASVSFRELLTEDELVRALVTGKVPRNRRPHLRSLLEEAPDALLKGLLGQLGGQTKPGKVEKNLMKIAAALCLPRAPR